MEFNKIEESVLKYWDEINLNDIVSEERMNNPVFNFLDGPPFINGKPHHGHLLVSYIKDSFSRFYSSLGYRLNNQLGFDCHGLPLEQEAEKVVGRVTNRDSIERIKEFNDSCRTIINNSTQEWYGMLKRVGRQFKTENTYFTSDKTYMESLWWGFQVLWNKGLVYRSKKVMPYSPKLGTPISNFEANSNYQDRTDTSVYVLFSLLNYSEKASLIAWTTTPWSLIVNQGLCVNPDLEYELVKTEGSNGPLDSLFILLKDKAKTLFKEYSIVRSLKGSELIGLEYEPIFETETPMRKAFPFKVYGDTYVKADSGTGIVHLAPLFGEDDMRVMLNNGYNHSLLPDIVDDNVKLKNDLSGLTDIKGSFIMDISSKVIDFLKSNKHIIKTQKIKHSYPYCWRTDVPLIYLAVDAWFINIQKIKDNLIENNKKITWFPDHIGTSKFDNWIRDSSDWCISRNRVWGTPIPVWISEDNELLCIGSIEELKKYLDTSDINDLHLDNPLLDKFIFNNKVYKRAPGVFDCWFESGMAGLASYGYPKCKEASYPVDFITESSDQTRGWFYTLNVLSTALNNNPAFTKVVVSGLILAQDGKKMSKRLQNYTSPNELINKYGSDFIRLYLIGSPASKAESFNFKDEDIKDIVKKFIPYMNSFNMLEESKKLKNSDSSEFYSKPLHILDKWIIQVTHKLASDIKEKINRLEINGVPFLIYEYWEKLTNDYVKLSRDRLKGFVSSEEAFNSISTLEYILHKSLKIISPFMPFMTEYLNTKLNITTTSIHYNVYKYDDVYDLDIINAFKDFNNVLEGVRVLRHKCNQPKMIPLSKLTIYVRNLDLRIFDDTLKNELNIKEILYNDITTLSFKYKPNSQVLGRTFKMNASKYAKEIEAGRLAEEVTPEMYSIEYLPGDLENLSYINQNYHLYLNPEVNQELLREAELNNMRRQINQQRKNLGLKIFDKVKIVVDKTHIMKLLIEQDLKTLEKHLNSELTFVEDTGLDYSFETIQGESIYYSIIR